MALTDSIFSPIPGPLISQFGINAVYIKKSQNQTYNPNTGKVSGYSSELPVKILITKLKPEEADGMQTSMVKILIAASSLGEYYPQITDSVRYMQNGKTRTAEINKISDYRGDSPIMHSVIARLS